MEKLSHTMIGRIISVTAPNMVDELIKDYTPLSRDRSLIPKMHEAVELLFQDMSRLDRLLLFIAVVYRVFIPVSFLPSIEHPDRDRTALQKLPTGIRDIIAECAGLKHAEEVNRYKHFAEPHTKNPRYRAKMQLVLDAVGLTAQNTES